MSAGGLDAPRPEPEARWRSLRTVAFLSGRWEGGALVDFPNVVGDGAWGVDAAGTGAFPEPIDDPQGVLRALRVFGVTAALAPFRPDGGAS